MRGGTRQWRGTAGTGTALDGGPGQWGRGRHSPVAWDGGCGARERPGTAVAGTALDGEGGAGHACGADCRRCTGEWATEDGERDR